MQPEYPEYRPPRLGDPRLAYGRGRDRYGLFPQESDLSSLQQLPVISPSNSSSGMNHHIGNFEQPVYVGSDVRSRSQNPVPSHYSIPPESYSLDNQWHNDAYQYNINPTLNQPVDSIRSRLTNFAQRSKEMIEDQKKLIQKQTRQLVSEKMEEEICACLPPLETFTGVSKVCRRKHFYESLVKGDILCVEVTAHADTCLICTILCMDGGKRRDIHDCEIKAYCPSSNCLPPTGANAEEGYQPKDTIRVIVVSYNDYDLKIIVSMKEEHLPKELRGHFKLGPISDEDLPSHFRRQLVMKKVNYDEILRTTLAFNNPGASSYLAQFFQLPISQRFSFQKDFHNVTYPEDEYFKHLRKIQSAENARQSVEEGVKYLKLGSYLEAQQCLNKALQIDSDNLDALVARGCLYANTNSLIKAAEDFDKALSIDPRHVNARKYASETLHEMGKLCEEKGDFDNAIRNYRRSCQVNVVNDEAHEALKSLIEIRGTRRSRSSQDELKNMYRDMKEKPYFETSARLTLLLEDDKNRRGHQNTWNRSRSRSKSSSSQSSDSESSEDSSSSSNSSSSSDRSNRRSRRRKKYKKSKSKKSKRKKDKKRKKGRKDSYKPIPGIKIQTTKEPSKDKKSSDTVTRNTPKMPSPKISFTIKKIEPENRTIKPTRPFASTSKSSTPKRNPITEKIVYNLDKLKPVPIEFVRNGPVEKPNEPINNRRLPPRRPRSRSRDRMYIPGRSRSRSPTRPRRRSRSRSRGRWRRGRSRSRSGSRAICRAVVSKKPNERSPNRRRSRSPNRRRSRSPKRNPTKSTNDTVKKVTDEAKNVEASLKLM